MKKIINKVQTIIDKYHSEAIIAKEKNGVFFVTNFPEPIEQTIIDFCECHYEVFEVNYFSFRFILKS